MDSNKTWWLNCTNNCEPSNRAGKKFNKADVADCTELIFEIQKVNEGHLYIKVGDWVTLKPRSSGSELGVKVVTCSDSDNRCRAKENCVAGDRGGGGKFDDNDVCEEAIFTIGALGKSDGDTVWHQDSINLTFLPLSTDEEQINKSLFKCRINDNDQDGQCYRLDCPLNFIGPSDSDLMDECRQPSTFLVTKL